MIAGCRFFSTRMSDIDQWARAQRRLHWSIPEALVTTLPVQEVMICKFQRLKDGLPETTTEAVVDGELADAIERMRLYGWEMMPDRPVRGFCQEIIVDTHG